MPTGITFSGLASGIDTDSIVRQLLALERLPITALQAKKSAEQAKLGAIDTLKSLVLTLQERAQAMRRLDDFLEFQVSASDDGVADFRVTGAATAGSHTLLVHQTAATDRWAADFVLDPDADLALADGEALNFSVDGQTYSIDVTAARSSLRDIAAAINAEAGADVTASVVNTGTTAAPKWRLVLASLHSGEEGRITGISSGITGLVIDGTPAAVDGSAVSSNHLVVGRNAEAVVDGLLVERATNEFSDVIEGLTFSVESADASLEVQFTVSPDYAAIQQKVVDLVDAYNAIVRFRNEQSRYDQDAGPSGPLFGDSLLSTVRQRVGNAFFGVPIRAVEADTEGYATLGVLGIEMQSDGTLAIDDEELESKLQGDIDRFADLFVDHDGFDNGGALPGTPEYYVDTSNDYGLADMIVRAVDTLVKTSTGPGGMSLKGAFGAKTAAIGDRIESIDDSIAAKERYLEVYEANLRRRFAALEQIISGLNAQGSTLSSIAQGFS